MAIVRWNPLDDILFLQRRMNKIFEDNFLGRKSSNDEELSSGLWSPSVDIYETESDIVLKAELPEVNQKDIKINIEDNSPLVYKSLSSLYERRIIALEEYLGNKWSIAVP